MRSRTRIDAKSKSWKPLVICRVYEWKNISIIYQENDLIHRGKHKLVHHCLLLAHQFEIQKERWGEKGCLLFQSSLPKQKIWLFYFFNFFFYRIHEPKYPCVGFHAWSEVRWSEGGVERRWSGEVEMKWREGKGVRWSLSGAKKESLCMGNNAIKRGS